MGAAAWLVAALLIKAVVVLRSRVCHATHLLALIPCELLSALFIGYCPNRVNNLLASTRVNPYVPNSHHFSEKQTPYSLLSTPCHSIPLHSIS